MLFALIWSLICGSFIGWLAGKLMNHPTSLIRNIVVGIVGSALGNWLWWAPVCCCGWRMCWQDGGEV